MSTESPFFHTKVECPICKTVNEFETIKVGSYLENGRDTDFCPKEITWKYQRYQSYNPLVYFTAVCTNCYYAREFNAKFKDWKTDNHFRSYRLKPVKEKHLDLLAQSDSVIRAFGETINVNAYPNESAILKIHLAIFDELLADRVLNLDLGRFYLRIAWLFRNLGEEENPNQQYLQGMFSELDNSFLSVQSGIVQEKETLEKFVKNLSAHFESADHPTDIQSVICSHRENFTSSIQELENIFALAETKLGEFKNLFAEYKTAVVGGEFAGSDYGFGDFHSLGEFLLNHKAKNDAIVSSEKEALVKSIHYYKEAFAGDREITPGNQTIQASYLIAELSRRVGDYDGAKEYFNNTIKKGQEFIYQHRTDKSRTALARKILELAIEQGKENMLSYKASGK